MDQSTEKETMSPVYSSKKGRHPTWGTQEDSRHHWRKVFFINGVKAGKRVSQKRKKYTRESIRSGIFETDNNNMEG